MRFSRDYLKILFFSNHLCGMPVLCVAQKGITQRQGFDKINFRIVPKSVLTPTGRPTGRRAIPKQLRLFPHVRFLLLSAKLFFVEIMRARILLYARAAHIKLQF